MIRSTLMLSTLALVLLGPAPLRAQCEYTAAREATLPAADATQLRLLARAGSLRVEGRPGLEEVRVRGTACASDARYLDAVRLVTDRSGDQLRVEVRMPEVRGTDRFEARLDLVVEVPARLALDVDDSSGEATIRGVRSLRMDDSSGALHLADIAGPLRVVDSSGELDVRDVQGDVWIEDSSGDIEVAGVAGGVRIERDGSGGIRVERVRGAVHVERDGSGGIRVADVGGDFVVERDGSGGVRYEDVAGAVRVPE